MPTMNVQADGPTPPPAPEGWSADDWAKLLQIAALFDLGPSAGNTGSDTLDSTNLWNSSAGQAKDLDCTNVKVERTTEKANFSWPVNTDIGDPTQNTGMHIGDAVYVVQASYSVDMEAETITGDYAQYKGDVAGALCDVATFAKQEGITKLYFVGADSWDGWQTPDNTLIKEVTRFTNPEAATIEVPGADWGTSIPFDHEVAPVFGSTVHDTVVQSWSQAVGSKLPFHFFVAKGCTLQTPAKVAIDDKGNMTFNGTTGKEVSFELQGTEWDPTGTYDEQIMLSRFHQMVEEVISRDSAMPMAFVVAPQGSIMPSGFTADTLPSGFTATCDTP